MRFWTVPRAAALATTLAGGVALVGLTPAQSANAADIRTQLTPDVIAQHCLANGVGSNAEGVFLLPNGQRVSGSILCTAEDMVAPIKAGRGHDDDDDHEEHEGEGDDD